ncbi:MAG: hypothetical protein ACXWUG_31240 [Polyangiales bacterium]
MNLLEARVALRHRTLLEVFDLALRFLFAHAAPFAALVGIVLVPCFVLDLVVFVHAGVAWGWVLAVALASFAQVPFTILASRLVFEDDVGIESVLAASLRSLPKLLGARILQVLGLLAGASFFLLPAVWIATTLLFLVEVIVLEHASVGTAFTRCQRLNAGEFGDALMTLMLLFGAHLGAVFLGDSALRTLLDEIFQITPPAGLLEHDGGILGLVSFWLFVPFVATARLLFYLNTRTKGEGWDVQTRFAAIAVRLQAKEPA